jgi:hypothetical protein
MSYDMNIIPARPGLTSDEVGDALERMCLDRVPYPLGEAHDALPSCLAEIFRHHPPMSGMTDEEAESSIWSIDPECDEGYIGLCMRWSTTPEQINGIIAIAHKHGLAVHDPQDDAIYQPPESKAAGSGGLLSKLFRIFGK